MRSAFKYTLVILFLAYSISSCSNVTEPEWEIAYKNDKDGNAILGSKEELINSIRQGVPVRIAWGGKSNSHSIEHISEPIWIAILDEKEVIAHLEPQVLSIIDWNSLSAKYTDSSKLNVEWRVVISTKGEFDAIWYDKKENRQIKRTPQNHTISWFVKNPTENKAKSFFEE